MPEGREAALAPRTGPPVALAPGTVTEAISVGTRRLAKAGCELPRLDAELLLAHALAHGSRAQLVLDAAQDIEANALARYEAMLCRRERREPVAYILGYRWFRGIRVDVDARVLIPRPETELLVEAALSLPPRVRVADVGTGSGAVALALALERPDLAVVGLDVSEEALAVARGTRDRLGVDIELVCADLLDGCRYDAVVANVPYVAQGTPLAPEIEMFEPAGALYAGADGLEVLSRLAGRLAACERVRFAALEVGLGQAAAVAELLSGAAFSTIEIHRDLAGQKRVVIGRR